jgi:hypothetical protein
MYNLFSRYIISLIVRFNLVPLSADPSVEEVQGRLRLIHGYHMSSTINLHECEVAAGLDLSELVAVFKLQVLNPSFVEALLTWPFKSLSPSFITEPVA